MNIEIPTEKVAFYDDVFGSIVDHLKDIGEVGEDEMVVELDFHVETEELVEVNNIETETYE